MGVCAASLLRSQRLYPGEYYHKEKLVFLIKGDDFHKRYSGKNRLPCQAELDELFESQVCFHFEFVTIPTSESRFNYVVSTYFPIELWKYFRFLGGGVYMRLSDYDIILKSLNGPIDICYPFTPLDLQNLPSRCTYSHLGQGSIHVSNIDFIPNRFRNKIENNIIPPEMVSEISRWAVTHFPYPAPESGYNKLIKYLCFKYPTIKFSYNQDHNTLSFNLSNDNFPELMTLSYEGHKGCRILQIEDIYKILWSQDPGINNLYCLEIEDSLLLIPNLVDIVKEYFSIL